MAFCRGLLLPAIFSSDLPYENAELRGRVVVETFFGVPRQPMVEEAFVAVQAAIGTPIQQMT